MIEQTLFDRLAGIEAGKEGQARVDMNADPDWKSEADAAIDRTARLMPRFTSDDVWEVGRLPRTRENRALGPRLIAAASRGVIEPTMEFTPTRQVKRHGSPVRYWRSLVCRGAA